MTVSASRRKCYNILTQKASSVDLFLIALASFYLSIYLSICYLLPPSTLVYTCHVQVSFYKLFFLQTPASLFHIIFISSHFVSELRKEFFFCSFMKILRLILNI